MSQQTAAQFPEDLFHRFHRPLTRFFRRKGASPEESEDLTQDIFLRILKTTSTFREDSSLETWLFRIARNRWFNHLRDRNTLKRGAPEVPLDLGNEDSDGDLPIAADVQTEPDPETRLLRRETVEHVQCAVRKLSPRMQECCRLRLRDLKYEEIAGEMSVSLQTVRSQLFQARQRLKEQLSSVDAIGFFRPVRKKIRSLRLLHHHFFGSWSQSNRILAIA